VVHGDHEHLIVLAGTIGNECDVTTVGREAREDVPEATVCELNRLPTGVGREPKADHVLVVVDCTPRVDHSASVMRESDLSDKGLSENDIRSKSQSLRHLSFAGRACVNTAVDKPNGLSSASHMSGLYTPRVFFACRRTLAGTLRRSSMRCSKVIMSDNCTIVRLTELRRP
jgi:hypothetical protein